MLETALEPGQAGRECLRLQVRLGKRRTTDSKREIETAGRKKRVLQLTVHWIPPWNV